MRDHGHQLLIHSLAPTIICTQFTVDSNSEYRPTQLYIEEGQPPPIHGNSEYITAQLYIEEQLPPIQGNSE